MLLSSVESFYTRLNPLGVGQSDHQYKPQRAALCYFILYNFNKITSLQLESLKQFTVSQNKMTIGLL